MGRSRMLFATIILGSLVLVSWNCTKPFSAPPLGPIPAPTSPTATPTGIVTSAVGSPVPTDTPVTANSPTLNPTSTFTLTGSPTPVPPTFTPTPVPSDTPTSSPTGSPSPCPTGVPATLNLSSGILAVTNVSAGTTFVGFALDASQNPGAIYNQIVRIQYQAQVTGNLSAEVTSAQLWLDNNSDSQIDAGDTLLQTIVTTPLSGSFISVTPPLTNTFPARLLVAFVASGTASGTLQVTLPNSSVGESSGFDANHLCVYMAALMTTTGQIITLP